jgi:hypothetical protein
MSWKYVKDELPALHICVDSMCKKSDLLYVKHFNEYHTAYFKNDKFYHSGLNVVLENVEKWKIVSH